MLDCFRKGSRCCDFALVELEAPIGDRDFDLRIRPRVDGKPGSRNGQSEWDIGVRPQVLKSAP